MEKEIRNRPVGVQVVLDDIEVILRGFDKYGIQKMAKLMRYINDLESQLQSRSLPVISVGTPVDMSDYTGTERRSKPRGGQ